MSLKINLPNEFEIENDEISRQEVYIYLAVKNSNGWLTAKEAADKAKVPVRTARRHLRRFVDAGLCDLAEVFPAHKYKFSKFSAKRNKAYFTRLEKAIEVFQ